MKDLEKSFQMSTNLTYLAFVKKEIWAFENCDKVKHFVMKKNKFPRIERVKKTKLGKKRFLSAK